MAANNYLNIATFNVNGMRAADTQSELFNLCKLHTFDILLLQETHMDNKRMTDGFAQELNYKCIWSFGTNRSCGVAILLSDDLDYKLEKHEYDFDGRLLFVDIEIHDVKYRIINIYAPNIEKDRKVFFVNLSRYLTCNRHIIMGGDFNCVENSTIDKFGRDSNPTFRHSRID